MKKPVQIISIALVTMSIGCKPGNNTTTTDVVTANILVNKTVDINQMYQFYYNDPLPEMMNMKLRQLRHH